MQHEKKNHIISDIQTCGTSLRDADARNATMGASPHISLGILIILDLLPFFLSPLSFSLLPLLILQSW